MINLLNRLVGNEFGATAIEYGLIAGGIALAIVAAVNTLGNALSTKYNDFATSLQ